jgi:hypothetical protein
MVTDLDHHDRRFDQPREPQMLHCIKCSRTVAVRVTFFGGRHHLVLA